MRGREPSFQEFFTDLIFLGLSVPVVLFVINFFVSGLGPYDFTLLELLNIFYSSVDYIFLKLSPVFNLFWWLALCVAAAYIIWLLIGMVGGIAKQ